MSKVLLGDVAHEHKETCKGSKDGYPIVGLEHLIPEEITLTTWDEGSENTFTKMFRKGNVLFGRRRAYLKKAAVAPFDGICSGDITVIEADPDKILPELLPFIIQNDDRSQTRCWCIPAVTATCRSTSIRSMRTVIAVWRQGFPIFSL